MSMLKSFFFMFCFSIIVYSLLFNQNVKKMIFIQIDNFDKIYSFLNMLLTNVNVKKHIENKYVYLFLSLLKEIIVFFKKCFLNSKLDF